MPKQETKEMNVQYALKNLIRIIAFKRIELLLSRVITPSTAYAFGIASNIWEISVLTANNISHLKLLNFQCNNKESLNNEYQENESLNEYQKKNLSMNTRKPMNTKKKKISMNTRKKMNSMILIDYITYCTKDKSLK